jgi:hypothetical protein
MNTSVTSFTPGPFAANPGDTKFVANPGDPNPFTGPVVMVRAEGTGHARSSFDAGKPSKEGDIDSLTDLIGGMRI